MDFAKAVYTDNDLNALKQIAKTVIESGSAVQAAGYEDFAKSLENVKVADEIKAVAQIYISKTFNDSICTEPCNNRSSCTYS